MVTKQLTKYHGLGHLMALAVKTLALPWQQKKQHTECRLSWRYMTLLYNCTQGTYHIAGNLVGCFFLGTSFSHEIKNPQKFDPRIPHKVRYSGYEIKK